MKITINKQTDLRLYINSYFDGFIETFANEKITPHVIKRSPNTWFISYTIKDYTVNIFVEEMDFVSLDKGIEEIHSFIA